MSICRIRRSIEDLPVVRDPRCQLLVAATLALAACGESEPGDPEIGVFTDGPVQGVHYASADFSGFTNAAGEFEYRPGQTVTFSIGDLILGSAEGAEQVTPFDLFDLAPPTDPREIREQLGFENQSFLLNRPAAANTATAARGEAAASRLAARHFGFGVTDLQRVANVANILVTLDNDRDPGNGLDLGGWHERLAGTDLDVDLPPGDLAEQLHGLARRYGLSRNTFEDSYDALGHLYRSLGIRVPLRVLVRSDFDFNANDVIDRIDEYDYDDRGRLTETRNNFDADEFIDRIVSRTYNDFGQETSEIDQFDSDDDGTINEIDSRVQVFNAVGDRLSRVTEQDDNADGTPEERDSFISTYNSRGRELTRLDEYDDDGTVNLRVQHSYTYNARGLEVGYLAETNEDADLNDEVDYRVSRVSTYDDRGLQLTWREEFDENLDDDLVSIVEYTYAYDIDGNRISWIDRRDTDGDGEDNSRHTRSYEFNADRQILNGTTEYDNDGDGDFESRQVDIFTYDGNGHNLSYLRQNYQDGDAINPTSIYSEDRTFDMAGNQLSTISLDNRDGVGDPESINTQTWEYDVNGQLVETTSTQDNDGNGQPNATFVTLYTHDNAGRLISQQWSRFSDANVIPDNITRISFLLDGAGNTLEVLYENDTNGDGEPDNQNRETFTYDDEGNQLSSFYESDAMADDNWVAIRRQTKEYAPIDDGLAYLLANLRGFRF